MNFENLLNDNLRKEDILSALCSEEYEAQFLFDLSDRIRKEYCGNKVQIRGLLEISNICGRNCRYCGVRRDNKNLPRYKMSLEEIYDTVLEMKDLGYRTAVMQSGESSVYSPFDMADLIRNIKKNTDMAVTLSFGEHSYENYKLWKEAGADRYLLRHETADNGHYAFLHSEGTLKERLECIKNLKDLGYQTGMGFMVGSPGQTLENIADDILLLKKYRPHMIGIGPYISHKETPFAGYENGSVFLTLKCLAIVRTVSKNALMPATTALASAGSDGFGKGLKAGCDVIMINCTPEKYRKLYEIYPNKHCIKENPGTILWEIKNLILSCGREISLDRGDAKF